MSSKLGENKDMTVATTSGYTAKNIDRKYCWVSCNY